MLSVLLATFDRPGPLADVLCDLVAQLPDRAEVIVVDQSPEGSAAQNRAAVAALHDPRFRWVGQRPPGLPEARNRGLRESSGSILLFLDDDVRLAPGCLAAHVAAYADPRVGGVGGRILEARHLPNAAPTVNRLDLGGRVRTNLSGERPVPLDTLKGANMSFRRSAILEASGFDAGFGGTAFLEDADASTRVAARGWDLRFVPEAAVTHLASPRGGVRQTHPIEAERWRFHNTGRFVAKHRPRAARPLVWATFAAIAARRAASWGDPSAVGVLMKALAQGLGSPP